MSTHVQRLPPERRHPADYRDDIEHAEVAQIMSELPEDHPARALEPMHGAALPRAFGALPG